MNENEEAKKRTILNKKTIFLLAGIILMLFLISVVSLYFFTASGDWFRPVFKAIPYPAAVVGNKSIVTTKDFLSNTDAMKKFYQENDFSEMGLRIDFSTEDGKTRLKIKEKDVFNKLVENKIIELKAKELGIKITKEEAAEQIMAKAKEAGSPEDLTANLDRFYDWSLQDFRDKVVVPQMYLKKLMDHYKNEVAKKKDLPKITKAKEELDGGADFEEVAKEYSEGETSEEGGDLGWLKKEHLVSGVAEKVFKMKEGEYSNIIQSSLGNHIVYLEETRKSGDEKEVKIKQIFTREGDFLAWLNEIKKEIGVQVLIGGYHWNEKEAEINFSNPELEKKERSIRIKSEGDPSI
ncbi:MAG: peptidylprolyl isomerase [Candidatus Moraniibacteriota bacterium]